MAFYYRYRIPWLSQKDRSRSNRLAHVTTPLNQCWRCGCVWLILASICGRVTQGTDNAWEHTKMHTPTRDPGLHVCSSGQRRLERTSTGTRQLCYLTSSLKSRGSWLFRYCHFSITNRWHWRFNDLLIVVTSWFTQSAHFNLSQEIKSDVGESSTIPFDTRGMSSWESFKQESIQVYKISVNCLARSMLLSSLKIVLKDSVRNRFRDNKRKKKQLLTFISCHKEIFERAND